MGFYPRGKSGQVVKFTTYLHLKPRLRMSGAIPLLPLSVCMEWTGTTLPLSITEKAMDARYEQ
jgi:hypothetical protein